MGSVIPPNNGALLDLKEWEAPNGGHNSIKGLGLPRVKLTSRNNITADISGVTAANADEHIGLVVFNVYEDECAADPFAKGPYVWDGNEWASLFPSNKDVKIFTDYRDPDNPVSYRYRDFGEGGVWMLDNLVAKRFEGETTDIAVYDGSLSGGRTTPSYTYPNAGTSEWGTAPDNWDRSLGLLYSWAAATNKKVSSAEEGEGMGSPNTGTVEETGVQGICPNGWHLPSDKEWNALEKVIAENPSTYSNSSIVTTWLPIYNYGSSAQIRGSHSPAMKSPCHVPGTTGDTNGKSFSSLLGGFNIKLVGVINGGVVQNYGTDSVLWSSSSSGTPSAWIRSLNNVESNVTRSRGSKFVFYSVRCKQN